MSDVAFANSPWWLKIIFMIGLGIMWLFDQIPVLIRRGEYRRLRDNDYVINDAHRALTENASLRARLAQRSPQEQRSLHNWWLER